MVGPTLYDIVGIIGLSVSGPMATFDMKPEGRYNIFEKNSYGEFIKHNIGDDGSPITDDEYVAFLYYWLNAIVFFSRSVSMQKLFIPLAALIHEKCKPTWFQHHIVSNDGDDDHANNDTWSNFLAIQVIPTGIPQYKKEQFLVTLHASHYVARPMDIPIEKDNEIGKTTSHTSLETNNTPNPDNQAGHASDQPQQSHQPPSATTSSPPKADLDELLSAMSSISHKIEIPSLVLATDESPGHRLPKELTLHAIEGLGLFFNF
ncbi:hypothetical protein Ahy_B01g057041 [Arachis hypogaea]|uniref:Aminotransferase-like plant mobile domain-containing protein n=1 Tax=Arachis hypogaea TaxID=3818 RepID=A0A445B044_ARAHY|nr:hypothetical protein Ahy_B01g057041 [Arachis hypogaea]